MTLYGIIFDWFWKYIWNDTNEFGNSAINDFVFPVGANGTDIKMGEWLCHTSTIIVLIAGCVLLFLLVKWLFKLFAGMISGVGR